MVVIQTEGLAIEVPGIAPRHSLLYTWYLEGLAIEVPGIQ